MMELRISPKPTDPVLREALRSLAERHGYVALMRAAAEVWVARLDAWSKIFRDIKAGQEAAAAGDLATPPCPPLRSTP